LVFLKLGLVSKQWKAYSDMCIARQWQPSLLARHRELVPYMIPLISITNKVPPRKESLTSTKKVTPVTVLNLETMWDPPRLDGLDLPSLTTLTLRDLTHVGNFFEKLPNLTSLVVDRKVSDFQKLSALTSLQTMKIMARDFLEVPIMTCLARLTNLTQLTTNTLAQFFSLCTGIKELRLKGAHPVSLSRLASLQLLKIHTDSLSSMDLPYLHNLRTLNFSDSTLHQYNPLPLHLLSSLHSLYLYSNSVAPDSLSQMVKLTFLTVIECGPPIHDYDLAPLTNLQHLGLGATKQVRSLKTLTNLEKLTTCQMPGLIISRKLSRLCSLTINNCSFPSHQLRKLTQLTHLSLDGFQATDEDVSVLTNLTSLRVGNSVLVTPECVCELPLLNTYDVFYRK
jgi:hypothetical protein